MKEKLKKLCLYILVMFGVMETSATAHVRHHHHPHVQKVQIFKLHKEVGIATWYGNGKYKNKNGFHHYTSNHEKFNPKEMTCAHRSFPFNTEIKVTDVKTGKSVIVRVNDRMKAKPPHVIDLTKTAAKQLGIDKKGKAIVVIEPIEVAEAPK